MDAAALLQEVFPVLLTLSEKTHIDIPGDVSTVILNPRELTVKISHHDITQEGTFDLREMHELVTVQCTSLV